MKKMLLLLLALASAGLVQAQNRTIILKSDGTVEDGSHNTLGYIRSDGTVEDSHRNTIGYIKGDGTIEDSHRTSIGYIKNDGTVEDSHRSTIGRESSLSRQQAAARYFFFR